jgi:hypothetical protein
MGSYQLQFMGITYKKIKKKRLPLSLFASQQAEERQTTEEGFLLPPDYNRGNRSRSALSVRKQTYGCEKKAEIF